MPGSVLGAAESSRCNHLLVESSVLHEVRGSDLRIGNSVAAWGRSQLREQVGGGRGGRWAEVRGLFSLQHRAARRTEQRSNSDLRTWLNSYLSLNSEFPFTKRTKLVDGKE